MDDVAEIIPMLELPSGRLHDQIESHALLAGFAARVQTDFHDAFADGRMVAETGDVVNAKSIANDSRPVRWDRRCRSRRPIRTCRRTGVSMSARYACKAARHDLLDVAVAQRGPQPSRQPVHPVARTPRRVVGDRASAVCTMSTEKRTECGKVGSSSRNSTMRSSRRSAVYTRQYASNAVQLFSSPTHSR